MAAKGNNRFKIQYDQKVMGKRVKETGRAVPAL
jgi:hypothetical protein